MDILVTRRCRLLAVLLYCFSTPGCTALHLAAANGYREIAKDLIEKGHANVDHKTNKGHTPRYMAKSRGQMQMVAFFDYLGKYLDLLANILDILDYIPVGLYSV